MLGIVLIYGINLTKNALKSVIEHYLYVEKIRGYKQFENTLEPDSF